MCKKITKYIKHLNFYHDVLFCRKKIDFYKEKKKSIGSRKIINVASFP
jgi:hypothetical protein